MNGSPSRSRDLLACLGDASRRRIVERLARGERCVTELARDVALSQSCTTRHLQALRRAGLVSGTREGRRILFRLRLDDPAVEGLLRWMLADAPGGTGAVERRRSGSDGGRARLDAAAPSARAARHVTASTRSSRMDPSPDPGSGGVSPEPTAQQPSPSGTAEDKRDTRPDTAARVDETAPRRPRRSEIEDFLL
jgi:DNA-binding transcriptional ArsR family regulator